MGHQRRGVAGWRCWIGDSLDLKGFSQKQDFSLIGSGEGPIPVLSTKHQYCSPVTPRTPWLFYFTSLVSSYPARARGC